MSMVRRQGSYYVTNLNKQQRKTQSLKFGSHQTLLPHIQTINDRFKAYYTELYKSQASANATDIQDFLEGLTLLQVAAEYKDMIAAPIAAEEITQAIRSMLTGKTPGPDGFPVEFYKVFISKLAPFLCLLFQEIT